MNVDADVLNESRVLGGLMEFGSDALWDLHWDTKYFYDTGMREVMQLILEQVDVNEPFDRVTVAVKAQRKFGNGDLNWRITGCWEDRPFTLIDLKFWHELLVQAWREREVQLQAKRMLDNPNDIPDAMQAIADANALVQGFDVLKTVQEDYDEHLQVREDGVALIPTGEPSIDRLLGGGWRAGIYGIAGRPKQGKSMVMLHFARKLAEQGRNVLFVSYEMDKHQVYDRLQAAVLGIDSNKIAKNELDFDADGDGVWARDKVRFSKDKMQGSLVITAPVDRDVTDLYKLIERTRAKLGGLDAVFVDYAQIMTLPKHRGTEAEMHSALSSRLQQLAMHVNMPVITGLQLRKPDTANEKRVPGTSDIAGSDKYARDVVAILYIIRSHVEGDDPMFGVGSELILKLDTSRFTPPGSARFIAEDKFSRIIHKEWR